ncbi:unnamed protein product [Microthlaspi erraticum]|uniref:DUF4283 domain-containing protein n=1 Tax=Microthlaspi erraticum TaxID=1685480 RepID=A0A6D2K742_9BRAS|nr:unnamed protein product [Microthlaspi erraticum]
MRKKKKHNSSSSKKNPSSSPSSASDGASSVGISTRLPLLPIDCTHSPETDSATSPSPVSPKAPVTQDSLLGHQAKPVSEIVVGNSSASDKSAKAVTTADPEKEEAITIKTTEPTPVSDSANVAAATDPVKSNPEGKNSGDSWCDLFKGGSKQLKKKGTRFTLPNGEVCVKIPNSVIENNRKSWDSFILGQFYSDPPSQGIVHSIVNGIWSRHFRDISVTKMEGFAFLFKIPNSATRHKVLTQRLWQIDGQTMFVAKWEPGLEPVKPELKEAPIWLELRKVPLQYFNDEGLEHIASLVGDPKLLHPSTANKTNLEVAKVFTIIDPRKPLPEVVNVQFDSGEIRRIEVSSPWMPPICSHCKQVGHSLKKCKSAPVTCLTCNSTAHSTDLCTRRVFNPKDQQNKKSAQDQSSKENPKSLVWKETRKEKPKESAINASVKLNHTQKGVSSRSREKAKVGDNSMSEEKKKSEQDSEAESDSSDVGSSESEEGEINSEDDDQYIEVKSRRNQRRDRGKGPKS